MEKKNNDYEVIDNKSGGNNMNDFRKFMDKNWGAILGGIIALILACTGLYRIIIGIILVCCGAWIGNYLQHHKEQAKNNMKDFIDKM